jgi:NAD(P)-dependent dehydrogenase (short-subunit alcohol dehydrogenase family)
VHAPAGQVRATGRRPPPVTVFEEPRGAGDRTSHLDARGLEVLGIGLSAGMVEVARRDYPHLRFEVGALEELPVQEDSVWGRIIFVSTESGVDVPADMVPYGVTKAGVIALSNGLAKRTRGTAVTSNTILGGPTWSDGVLGAVESIAADRGMAVEQLRAAIIAGRPTSLLQRFIEPDEIAHLAAYLASPLSAATNGAALRADGGVLTTCT